MERTIADSPARDDESLEILKAALGAEAGGESRCRDALAAASDNLEQRFESGEAVGRLVRERSHLVDYLLGWMWARHAGEFADRAALVAVGGYGRGELHPYSDIDIMVLVADAAAVQAEPGISTFLTALWDAGLEIGHSVRTPNECRRQAINDITIATTLMEARLLAGPEKLLTAMEDLVGPPEVWPADRFFAEKRKEQDFCI